MSEDITAYAVTPGLVNKMTNPEATGFASQISNELVVQEATGVLSLWNTPILVFDVESIGIHGEGFAVGGLILLRGEISNEFRFWCNPELASGTIGDLDWVKKNVPRLTSYATNSDTCSVRHSFWRMYKKLQKLCPGLLMAGECVWPVEANFLTACIKDGSENRCWQGPYPLYDITSIMLAAGMDPMKKYDRKPNELPEHDPLCDARLSARLLNEAMTKLTEKN